MLPDTNKRSTNLKLGKVGGVMTSTVADDTTVVPFIGLLHIGDG